MSTGKGLLQRPTLGQGHVPSSSQGPSPAQTGHMDISSGLAASCGSSSMADSHPQGKAMPEAPGPSGRCGQQTLGTALPMWFSDKWLTAEHCVLARGCRPAGHHPGHSPKDRQNPQPEPGASLPRNLGLKATVEHLGPMPGRPSKRNMPTYIGPVPNGPGQNWPREGVT